MVTEQEEKLKYDFAYSLLLAVLLFSILYILNSPTALLDNLSAINSTITTALGILFTVLAIIYTFESQFENNRAVKILKRQGKYEQISEIFILSIAAIGVVWVMTFFLAVSELHSPLGEHTQYAISFAVIVGFILSVIRLYRCFRVFVLLNNAVKSQEGGDRA